MFRSLILYNWEKMFLEICPWDVMRGGIPRRNHNSFFLITRPRPAFGRLGLGGSLGGYTLGGCLSEGENASGEMMRAPNDLSAKTLRH